MINDTFPPRKDKKLLDQLSEAIRIKHYSYRTEQTYREWIKRYILFHNKRHPRDMGLQELQQFLAHLAIEKHVAASTQNKALSAILFLYRHVLETPIEIPPMSFAPKNPKPCPPSSPPRKPAPSSTA